MKSGGVRALILVDEIVVRVRFLIRVLNVFGELSILFKIMMKGPGAAGCLVLVHSWMGFPPKFWIAEF